MVNGKLSLVTIAELKSVGDLTSALWNAERSIRTGSRLNPNIHFYEDEGIVPLCSVTAISQGT